MDLYVLFNKYKYIETIKRIEGIGKSVKDYLLNTDNIISICEEGPNNMAEVTNNIIATVIHFWTSPESIISMIVPYLVDSGFTHEFHKYTKTLAERYILDTARIVYTCVLLSGFGNSMRSELLTDDNRGLCARDIIEAYNMPPPFALPLVPIWCKYRDLIVLDFELNERDSIISLLSDMNEMNRLEMYITSKYNRSEIYRYVSGWLEPVSFVYEENDALINMIKDYLKINIERI